MEDLVCLSELADAVPLFLRHLFGYYGYYRWSVCGGGGGALKAFLPFSDSRLLKVEVVINSLLKSGSDGIGE
jgi:hypothetical protein